MRGIMPAKFSFRTAPESLIKFNIVWSSAPLRFWRP